jgi:hypothetical protein
MSERAEAASWIVRSREDTLFADLYNRHYRAIRDFCRRRVPKDMVDDAVAASHGSVTGAVGAALAGLWRARDGEHAADHHSMTADGTS